MATIEQYRVWLAEAEEAEHKLALGQATTSASYYGRSVTYTAANLKDLQAYIQRLKVSINGGRTRARRIIF